MELLRGIQTRRSVRAFKDRPIEKSILKKIILAATNAPSYSNTQPWEIAIVTGKKKREQLIQNVYQAAYSKQKARPHLPFPKRWPEEMRKRAFLHMTRRYETVGVSKKDREGKRNEFLQNFLFFNASAVIIVYMDEGLGPWSIFDMGLFVQNLILAAHGMGLGTCIQAMSVSYPDIIAKCLGISLSKKIVVAIPMGYEDKGAPINRYLSEKKKIEEWVKWL